MAYLVELQAPGSSPQQHDLRLGSLSIGSGEEAELLVAVPSFLSQHLALDVGQEGVAVRVLAESSPPLVFEGSQVREATVPWGSDIFTNGVRLSFFEARSERRGAQPVLLAALAGALVWLAWQGAGAMGHSTSEAVAPLELAVAIPSCSSNDPAEAVARARHAEALAKAKQERYPFDSSEGLGALERLQLAQACFQAGGASVDATRVAGAYQSFQQTLVEDLAALCLRLDRAREQGHPREALAAATAIDALVAPLGETPYRSWLRDLRRQLDQK